MDRNFIKLVIFTVILSTQSQSKIYKNNCVECHKLLPISLQEIFMSYLLVYGGEKNFKAGLKHYLKNPSKSISVMSDLFKKSYKIKQKTKLSDKEIDNAINEYWDKFSMFKRLY